MTHPALVEELLLLIPPKGDTWPRLEQWKWLAAAREVFALSYPYAATSTPSPEPQVSAPETPPATKKRGRRIGYVKTKGALTKNQEAVIFAVRALSKETGRSSRTHREISRESGIPLSSIPSLLQALHDRGLICVTSIGSSDRPAVFEIINSKA